jgi:hypothetical protein
MTGLPSKPKGGIEVLLRSMGLGEVLDVSQKLANQGTVDAILKFAKGLDELNENIATFSGRLERIEAALGISPERSSEGQYTRAEVEPGSGASDFGPSGRTDGSTPREYRANGAA